MARTSPNIVITGTPGVGKSSHCTRLAAATGLRHISINDVVKGRACHEGWDVQGECWVVDEEKLLDELEAEVKRGGTILDWHAVDLWPESWVDLVVVLRAGTEVLYDRLSARGYKQAKLQENLDAEIMQVLLDEARESFDERLVIELRSETDEDLAANCGRIEQWIVDWRRDRGVVGR